MSKFPFDAVRFFRDMAAMFKSEAGDGRPVMVSSDLAGEMSRQLAAIADELDLLASEKNTYVTANSLTPAPTCDFKLDNDWQPSASDPPLLFGSPVVDGDPEAFEASDRRMAFISWEDWNARIAKRIEESS